MGYIYKITNDINGKIYIGQTVKKAEYRFKEHIRTAQSRYKDGYKLTHFQQAIIKYGKEHFHLEIIEECDFCSLDDREIYWIEYYDSYNNGYNMTTGGQEERYFYGRAILQYNLQGQYIQTFINAREASEKTGLHESTIRKACRNQTLGGNYQWRFFEINFPLQISPITELPASFKRKVKQYNLKGELINRFDSLQEASRQTGVNASNISRACKIKGTSKAGGYQWRFEEDKDIPINIEKPKKQKQIPKTQLPVSQYSKEIDFIKDWNTIKEAANALGIRSSLIINVCEQKQQTAGGYYWVYKNLK